MSEREPTIEPEIDPEETAQRPWHRRVREEVVAHPMAYLVMLAFVIAGPIVTSVLFPEAPRGAGLLGGVAFGAYAALCAMPGRFL